MPLVHRSHDLHDTGLQWVLHGPRHAARCSLLHPAPLSTYCFTSPAFGKTEGQREGQLSAPTAASEPQTSLGKELFSALEGPAGTVLWLAHPPSRQGQGGCSVLGEDSVWVSTPARSAHGTASATAPKGCWDLLRLCPLQHPMPPGP